MKEFVSLITGILIALAIGSLAFVLYVRTDDFLKLSSSKHDLEVSKALSEAIDGCFKSAIVTSTTKDGVTTEPSMFNYHLCLKDKGIDVQSAK